MKNNVLILLISFLLLLVLGGLVVPNYLNNTPPSDTAGIDGDLKKKVGQIFIIGLPGVTSVDDGVRSVLEDINPSGIAIFRSNIESPEQLKGLIADLQKIPETPYFIAIDAEGGVINRLVTEKGFAIVTPSAQTLGKRSVEKTGVAIRTLSSQLQSLGINWNFAPVVAVNINPEGEAIGALERSFSADPEIVISHAKAFIQASESFNVIPTIKHFPGLGSAANNTDFATADTTDTFRSDEELLPYRHLIGTFDYNSPVMVTHVINRDLDPSGLPASLSKRITTDLLRDQMGFEGVIVVDDMQAAAIVQNFDISDATIKAILAGVDIIMFDNTRTTFPLQATTAARDAVLQAVKDGTITEEQFNTSLQRIKKLREKFGVE